MKTPLKVGLFISLFVFGLSLLTYFGTDTDLLNFSSYSLPEWGTKELSSLPKKQTKQLEMKEHETLKADKQLRGKTEKGKVTLRELEIIKNRLCKKALGQIEEMGDYIDPKAEVFKEPQAIMGKLDFILGDINYANIQYLNESSEYLISPYGKSEILKRAQAMSGCSGSADIGIILSTVLEAIKDGDWSALQKKKTVGFFLKLALSEVRIDSWTSLVKASGILMPILLELHPDSTELAEVKSFRADILRESLNSKDLLRKSRSDSEAIIIEESAREQRAFYREQLERILDSVKEIN
jgi:hypothetical protein